MITLRLILYFRSRRIEFYGRPFDVALALANARLSPEYLSFEVL